MSDNPGPFSRPERIPTFELTPDRVAMLPSHKHQLLECDESYIRLLDILPGKGSDIVRCVTVPQPREQAVNTYEPISYTWGSSANRETIVCDEHQLSVGVNLVIALRKFRLPDRTRRVWADGICVDQDNPLEKGLQVKHMGSVYEQGTHTLIWLGEDPEGIAPDAFKLVDDTVKYLDGLYDKHGDWSFPKDPAAAGIPVADDKARWDAVGKLYNTSWFERVWIVQEAGLSKSATVYWGNGTLDIASVIELAFWMSWRTDLFTCRPTFPAGRMCDSFAQIQSTFTAASGKSWRDDRPLLKYLAAEYGPKKLFVSILDTARECQATDGRDFVYGFLGHPCAQKADGELMFVPDYTKSLEDTSMDTAIALLANPREAQWVLSRVNHHHSKDIGDGFPSWVPRWHNGWVQHPHGGPLYTYCAGGEPEQLQPRYIPEERGLALKGFVVDKIKWTGILIDRDNLRVTPDKWLHDPKTLTEPPIETWWKDVLKVAKPSTPEEKEKLETAFSWALASGYGRISKLGAGAHQASYEAFLDLSRANLRKFQGKPAAEESGEKAKGEADPFDYYFRTRHSHNRRLALTEGGRLIHVDGIAEEGDVYAVFYGLQTPFIIRPAENGRFYFIGACFAHGDMYGELAIKAADGEYDVTDIVLV